MTTLRELKAALEQPFPIEAVQFLLKDVRQDEGKWSCLALPYCNKRIYEDRLNELAYGEWQTPYTAPYIHDNKLIIPATVVLCGVTHTDYGEAFLAIQSKNGTAREDENSATDVYRSQKMSQKLLTQLRSCVRCHRSVNEKTLPVFASLVQNVSNKVSHFIPNFRHSLDT